MAECSGSLYGKLKNIPDEIETLKKNTQLFIDLLWMISGDFDGPINAQVHSLHVTHRVTSILHEAAKESEELALLLENLSANNSSSTRRKWSAVVSVTKEKGIAERCRRIESLKLTLQLWYQHQNDARLRRVEQQLSKITHSQNAVQTSMGLLVLGSNTAIVKRLDLHEDPVPSLKGPLGHRRRQPRRNAAFCTCHPSGSSAYLSIYSLQLFYSQEISHLPNCHHRDGSTSWSCGVRALSPKIQMMVGIQLGGWTFSMVGRLSPHNVVDPEESPAFIAIHEASEALRLLGPRREISIQQPKYWLEASTSDGLWVSYLKPISVELRMQEEVRLIFDTLFRNLLEAFESGKASPSDHRANGATLLHDFVHAAMDCVSLHEPLYQILDDIVKLLVAGNVDPNAYMSGTGKFKTPFYCMSLHLEYPRQVQDNKLDGILIKHGCDTSQALQSWAKVPHYAELLKKNYSILEDHDQYLAYLVVMRKSEAELRRLLIQNKIDLKTKSPSILSLAVGWTSGLQILLNAGANPNDAILVAIWEDHLPSVELLIDNGCSLFGHLHQKNDVFFYANSISASSDMVCLLTQKLADRRLELVQAASREPTETCLKRHGRHKQQHVKPSPEYNAIEIFRQLEAHKVQVPISLWPYHHRDMTCALAKKLYSVGFCGIEERDRNGISPLVKTLIHLESPGNSNESILLAQWYLNKGSRLPRSWTYVDFLDRFRHFTDSVSACVWTTKESGICGPLNVFKQLHPEGVEQRDRCSCWCSTSGCIPVAIVLRLGYWGLTKFTNRQRWLFNLSRYSSLGLCLHKDTFADICRLEVFDRLGMVHTCSHRYHDYGVGDECYGGRGGGDDNNGEREEIQEEDRHLKQALDSYLDLYLSLLCAHTDRFESFWIAWWIALEYFLPFEVDDTGIYLCHPLKFDSPCDPQRYDKAQSHDGYGPNVEAITAFLADCIPQINSELREKFLGQFVSIKGEALAQSARFGWR
ncbi:hypothetical protein CEP54_002507 [Fusarium duplospermum]|uniref:Uncharacterized protein n=1 Tax=Fusarium duplospermum TaxID=1325734 RepID=A0A428QUE1_9HYPO|nr:hypothetical protein CEP54_002507 [Fusarium duplospermum]